MLATFMSEVECEEIKRDYSGTSGSGAKNNSAAMGDGTGDRRCYFTRTRTAPLYSYAYCKPKSCPNYNMPIFIPCGCETILCNHYGSQKKIT